MLFFFFFALKPWKCFETVYAHHVQLSNLAVRLGFWIIQTIFFTNENDQLIKQPRCITQNFFYVRTHIFGASIRQSKLSSKQIVIAHNSNYARLFDNSLNFWNAHKTAGKETENDMSHKFTSSVKFMQILQTFGKSTDIAHILPVEFH